MGLYVKGALISGNVLKEAAGDKPALYAFTLEDEQGEKLEVLAQEVLGTQGEIVEVPVNAQVRKDRTGALVDRVSFWSRKARQVSSGAAIPGFAPKMVQA